MTDNPLLRAKVATSVKPGADLVKALREARGYSIEDLGVACGLTVSEIASIESGKDADPRKLRRIASALQLPQTIPIDAQVN